MKIRRAKLSDAPAIAKVGTQAFAKDASYGHFYPWRDQFPDDFYKQLLHNYKKKMVTPGAVVVIMELDKADQEKSTEDLKAVEETVSLDSSLSHHACSNLHVVKGTWRVRIKEG
jgi:hypothetical protein